MKKKILLVVLMFPVVCCAQSIKSWDITVGGLIAAGEHVSNAYTLGSQVQFGPRIETKYLDIVPQVSTRLFSSNASSDVKDNLFLYGVELAFFYPVQVAKLDIEPMLGIGYSRGTNFLSYREKDFIGGLLHGKDTMMKTSGMAYEAGVFIKVFRKIKAGATYRYHQPGVTLSDAVKADVISSSNPTELYGEQVSFPDQKMNLSSVSILLIIGL